MRKQVCALALMLAAAGTAHAAISASEAARLTAAAQVVNDIKTTIPQEYWSKARCVAVIPDLKKAAFIIGGEFGKGVMSCRSGDRWSPPVFMQLAKGSWGFQAGAEQVDVVLLVMNEQGVQKLLQNKVTLGADASIAAGPLGRQGSVGTDAALTAEILSYSRAQGLFAGINLSGGVLRPDEDSNAAAYGKGASPRTILANTDISAPTQASAFLRALDAQSVASAATSAATSIAPTAERPAPAPTAPTGARTTTMPTTDDDLRVRLVDLQQTLDRILADTTPAPVGTSGTAGAAGSGTVTVDRARLLQLRQQLGALMAAINRR
jgi:SH3 domain-containing YSC84-like protein 1